MTFRILILVLHGTLGRGMHQNDQFSTWCDVSAEHYKPPHEPDTNHPHPTISARKSQTHALAWPRHSSVYIRLSWSSVFWFPHQAPDRVIESPDEVFSDSLTRRQIESWTQSAALLPVIDTGESAVHRTRQPLTCGNLNIKGHHQSRFDFPIDWIDNRNSMDLIEAF